jgi:hypothetical protein
VILAHGTIRHANASLLPRVNLVTAVAVIIEMNDESLDRGVISFATSAREHDLGNNFSDAWRVSWWSMLAMMLVVPVPTSAQIASQHRNGFSVDTR